MAMLKTIRGEDRRVAMVRVDALTWADDSVTHYEVEITPRVQHAARKFDIFDDIDAVDAYVDHEITRLEVLELLYSETQQYGSYEYIDAIGADNFDTVANKLIDYFIGKQCQL